MLNNNLQYIVSLMLVSLHAYTTAEDTQEPYRVLHPDNCQQKAFMGRLQPVC